MKRIVGGIQIVTGVAALLCATPLPAQSTVADSALAACSAAARGRREAEAKAEADRAERLFRARIAASPREVEARVGLARTLSECRIPLANFMQAGQLVGESSELLEEALAIDSTHWTARFVLAMNHYHTPAFLGRTGDAIREFERLLARQGNRADRPVLADPYLRLGELYLRSRRRDDALEVWRRGAALFPGDERLRRRLEENGERTGANGTGAAAPAAPAAPRALEGLVVRASGIRMDDTRGGTSLRRLDVLTTPGDAVDLMQAFQTVPGTTRAAEGSDLYVRGGDPAEAPVFVDGARLVYPGRYENLGGGVMGILDSNVIRSAYFSSGGFSARYGDALSGVLDVETEGRPEASMRQLNLNTVQAGAILRAPLGERGGVWGTLRGSNAALLLAMHGRSADFAAAPWSLEGMVGATWEPREGTAVRAVALVDGDASAREVEAFGFRGPFRSHGENRLLGLSARAVSVDGRAGIRANLSLAERGSGFRFGVLDRERSDRGARLRLEGDLAWGVGGRVRAGVEGALLDAAQRGTVPTTDRLAPGSPSRALDGETETATHLGGYLEAERAFGSGVALVAGVRADRLPGEDAWTVDPRASLALSTGEWTLRLGGGEFHQGRWRTRYQVPDAGAPSGTPRRARHLVAGAERRGEPSLRVESYLKRYGSYVAAGDGPRITAGEAAGVDAMLRWTRQARLNGWITYSYLHGRVELEDGIEVPSAVDVTHTLTGVAKLSVGRRWEVGSTLRYGTGRPFTPVVGAGTDEGAPALFRPVYGPTHGERLPAYARLDGRITRFVTRGSTSGVVYLEMLNLLDRDNVAAYTYDAAYRERRAVSSFFSDRTLVLGMGLTFR
ncbi:MAG TPA: TonB-dependent receptor plug domain-containing protein [Longimicrobiaceae bacterium]|nr:TonB-dependent receptor plug domain-containing protein [Longimicrobiaceae bacterium]